MKTDDINNNELMDDDNDYDDEISDKED